jgi:hypothetical protein
MLEAAVKMDEVEEERDVLSEKGEACEDAGDVDA